MEFDPFVLEVAGLHIGRLAVDAALLDLAVVDFARFLGEFLADVIAILFDLVVQRLDQLLGGGDVLRLGKKKDG